MGGTGRRGKLENKGGMRCERWENVGETVRWEEEKIGEGQRRWEGMRMRRWEELGEGWGDREGGSGRRRRRLEGGKDGGEESMKMEAEGGERRWEKVGRDENNEAGGVSGGKGREDGRWEEVQGKRGRR